jgi:drug/metabolite transporter (DMT)-like permease
MLIAWPAFGEVRSLLKFVGLFITAGGLLLIHRGEQASAHQIGQNQPPFVGYLIRGFG